MTKPKRPRSFRLRLVLPVRTQLLSSVSMRPIVGYGMARIITFRQTAGQTAELLAGEWDLPLNAYRARMGLPLL